MPRKCFVGVVVLLAGGLVACGGGRDKEQPDASAGDDAAAPIVHEDDDVMPCPDRIPTFEAGMIVVGAQKRIRARLVSATPIAPRKYENSWTFEFLDADEQPISDVMVDPQEPWMDVHNHGGGWPPDVVTLDEPGQLEFDRINLKMSGPWRLNLNAHSDTVGDDVIVVEACVP